eukprot:1137148-Pelagomonas_calceolata.AAC.2
MAAMWLCVCIVCTPMPALLDFPGCLSLPLSGNMPPHGPTYPQSPYVYPQSSSQQYPSVLELCTSVLAVLNLVGRHWPPLSGNLPSFLNIPGCHWLPLSSNMPLRVPSVLFETRRGCKGCVLQVVVWLVVLPKHHPDHRVSACHSHDDLLEGRLYWQQNKHHKAPGVHVWTCNDKVGSDGGTKKATKQQMGFLGKQ